MGCFLQKVKLPKPAFPFLALYFRGREEAVALGCLLLQHWAAALGGVQEACREDLRRVVGRRPRRDRLSDLARYWETTIDALPQ